LGNRSDLEFEGVDLGLTFFAGTGERREGEVCQSHRLSNTLIFIVWGFDHNLIRLEADLGIHELMDNPIVLTVKY
jgi:hypothetical protein